MLTVLLLLAALAGDPKPDITTGQANWPAVLRK
jgi:hypothetical protein